MKLERESGVLLHPTSLPGPYGIGEIGPEAEAFARFLQETGQHLWQVLPLGPTSYGDSPYQSPSTFAGNPLLISFDWLIEDGLLTHSKLRTFPKFPEHRVDFGPVITARVEVLQTVGRGFDRKADAKMKAEFNAFCEHNAYWLDDFSLFMALKDAHGGIPWTEWEAPLAQRHADALAEVSETYKASIKAVKVAQYLFERYWNRLRTYCRERGIKFVGDIPIFVAHDSADVWAHPDLFFLNERGYPTVVAGVPPDYFSQTGQLWGNPLYRWEVHQKQNYAWWAARLRRTFEMVDIVRIDHFRGFEAYWEIPAHETTAINGKWIKGPNSDIFDALLKQMGKLPIIAEDLGIITPEVNALRDRYEFPGMRILQFAFGNDDRADEFRPESYPKNTVVYTGTHDNDTTVGWFRSEPGKGSTRSLEEIAAERKVILDYLRTDGTNIQWDMIELAMRSNANTVVTPLQDIMGLDSSARMNIPGTQSGNWQWRFTWDMLKKQDKERLEYLTRATGRRH